MGGEATGKVLDGFGDVLWCWYLRRFYGRFGASAMTGDLLGVSDRWFFVSECVERRPGAQILAKGSINGYSTTMMSMQASGR